MVLMLNINKYVFFFLFVCVREKIEREDRQRRRGEKRVRRKSARNKRTVFIS